MAAPATPADQPPPASAQADTGVDQIAGIILGLFLSGLLIALLKGGWSRPGGAKTWWNAKFLGKVT